ncbi:MAG: dihydroorotate dehydrogenase [Caldimicrobium sp.]
MSRRLFVQIKDLSFKSPIFLASGTWGLGDTLLKYLHQEEIETCIGALITKGISLNPMSGNPPPRLLETPCGLINSIGLENPGIENFLKKYFPKLKTLKVPIIFNLHGKSKEEFIELAKKLSNEEIDGIEINISCPNVSEGGIAFSQSPKLVYDLVRAVREVYPRLLIVKLSPVGPWNEVAIASEEAGADALTVANTYPALGIVSLKPFQIIKGGLSGPAIKPLTLRLVYELSSKIKIPLIASGGITTGKDALEYLLVGAKAVQIGTANLIDPTSPVKIYRELKVLIAQFEENQEVKN